MITIDATISILAGAGLALTLDASDSSSDDQVLNHGFIFQNCFLSPTIFYYLTRFSDWEWNYFFPARHFFSEASLYSCLVFVLLMAFLNISFYLGFKIAKNKIRSNKKNHAKLFFYAVCSLLLVTSILISKRAIYVGDFNDFHAGIAPYAWENKEFILTLLLSGLVVGIPYSYLLFRKPRR